MKTFSAPTMAEALQRVKGALGPDAVILHTRTFVQRYCLGLRRREVVEIIAGKGVGVGPRQARRGPASGSLPQMSMKPAMTAAGLPRAPAPTQASAATAASGAQKLLQTPAAGSAMMLSLSEDVGNLKSMLTGLVKEVRSQKAPQIPEELFDHYLGLIQNEVAEELASDVMKAVQLQVRGEHIKNVDYVRVKLAEQIEKMLPTAGPLKKTRRDGPHVVALIGPTGVGKTTTVAKLAANLKLRENRKVGLITIDTFRIAAVDQLKRYADIIGSPLQVVNTPEDLKAAVASMSDCDFVLIDTAGRSPSDALKLRELKNFIAQANPDEVHLVLSSTASQECIERAISRFGDVRVDRIIFTKLDEAVHVGVMLNVIRKVNKAVSYITTGQDVPDDIEVVQARKLAQLILGGGNGGGAA